MEVKSVAEQMFFTTVRVETSDEKGRQGTGTSSIFDDIHNGTHYAFVVTNKHVVGNAKKGRLSFLRSNDGRPDLGNGWSIEVDEFYRAWFGHPDPEVDVAIIPLGGILKSAQNAGIKLFFRAVGSDIVPPEDSLQKLDALEEVVFIGYPVGIWDTKNLLPIMRRGITATPITVDFQGKPQFLVDASVFPGSSGSPVFLYNAGIYSEKGGGTVVGSRLMFLGIISSVFFQQDLNEIRMMSIPTTDVPVAVSKQMVDLGIVFKSKVVVETIRALLKERGLLSK